MGPKQKLVLFISLLSSLEYENYNTYLYHFFMDKYSYCFRSVGLVYVHEKQQLKGKCPHYFYCHLNTFTMYECQNADGGNCLFCKQNELWEHILQFALPRKHSIVRAKTKGVRLISRTLLARLFLKTVMNYLYKYIHPNELEILIIFIPTFRAFIILFCRSAQYVFISFLTFTSIFLICCRTQSIHLFSLPLHHFVIDYYQILIANKEVEKLKLSMTN